MTQKGVLSYHRQGESPDGGYASFATPPPRPTAVVTPGTERHGDVNSSGSTTALATSGPVVQGGAPGSSGSGVYGGTPFHAASDDNASFLVSVALGSAQNFATMDLSQLPPPPPAGPPLPGVKPKPGGRTASVSLPEPPLSGPLLPGPPMPGPPPPPGGALASEGPATIVYSLRPVGPFAPPRAPPAEATLMPLAPTAFQPPPL
eukprot:c48726_g1_i1.p2 GENE.c48726_g1_i1~~c48726_g1_i1.p2  ORF type:complete len:204 (+),score=22.90 c48726_g1_i1:1-612(+)